MAVSGQGVVTPEGWDPEVRNAASLAQGRSSEVQAAFASRDDW